ncbi:MAG TPA: alpha/beta fold hydrolase [Elusimicrobiota bacterium]|nr:alpha/beta fold hydrolase [Elusimicrobiota bacterium]
MKTDLRSLYPFAPRFADVGGARMHYVDEGAGEPLVMVHGNPSWSFFFRSLILGLRGEKRCVAMDHVGCGLSDKPGDERYAYTLRRRVDDLEALLEKLGLDRDLTMVLHDWGGMIGMAYASRHPDRVKRLVFLNTAAFLLPPGKRLPWTLRLARRPLGAVLIRGFNAFARGTARIGCPKRPMPPDVLAAYLAPYDSWANRIATLRFVQDIPLLPGDPAYDVAKAVDYGLPRFARTPAIILWGAKDPVFDADFLAEWRNRLPAAKVREFPDAGHYLLEDEPEAALAEIRSFLAANPLPVRA